MVRTRQAYIENMTETDCITDVKAAWDLTHAQRATPNLAVELPYIADGYRSFLPALHRQLFVRTHANKANLIPLRLMNDAHYIGMATVQLLDPVTSMRDGTSIGPEFTNGAELAYWHRPVEDPVRLGCDVVDALLSVAGRVGVHVVPWILTIPGDTVKSEVCLRMGFEPADAAIPYAVDDGVLEPRHLWVHPSVT